MNTNSATGATPNTPLIQQEKKPAPYWSNLWIVALYAIVGAGIGFSYETSVDDTRNYTIIGFGTGLFLGANHLAYISRSFPFCWVKL